MKNRHGIVVIQSSKPKTNRLIDAIRTTSQLIMAKPLPAIKAWLNS